MAELSNGYPLLEWDSLKKGQRITELDCARALGVTVARLRAERLLLVKLAAAIREHRDDLRCHVRTRD